MAAKQFIHVTLFCAVLACACQSAAAQLKSQPAITDEDGLVSALLADGTDRRDAAARLLIDYRPLVTTGLWDKLMARAGWAYYYDSPAKAFVAYDVAREVARQLNDKRLLAITHHHIGRSHSGVGQIERAIAAYLESKKSFEEAGLQRDLIYVLGDLSALHLYSEDYKQAALYAEQSIALAEKLKASDMAAGAWPDDYGVATAYSTLGSISYHESRYDQALGLLQKALALYQGINRDGGKYDVNIVDALASLGRVYGAAGDHRSAFLHLNRALELARMTPNRDRVAVILNNLGNLYLEQGNYSGAIQFFTQSLQIYREINGQVEAARALVNIGLAHLKERNYDEALQALGESLKTAEEKKVNHLIIVATEGIGAVYRERGDYAQASRWLDRSWRLAKEAGDEFREAELSWLKAEVLLDTGDVDGAAALAGHALKIAEQIRSSSISYLASTVLGKAYLRRRDDRLAASALARAIEAVEAMRHGVAGREREQALFFENKLAPYHLMIEMLVRQGRFEEALTYVERAKGRVLGDVLSGGKVDLAGAMATQERAEERRLNRVIVDLNRRVAEERRRRPADAARIKGLEAELQAARLKYEHFQNLLYAAHQRANLRGGRRAPFALDEMRDVLRDGKTLALEYVVLPKVVYLFAVAKDRADDKLGLSVHRIEVDENLLSGLAAEFRKLLADRNPAFAGPARRLYDLLVKPAAARLGGRDTLCVMPDGPLWNLPFQALRLPDNRYLLEDYALYYAPSLGTLSEMSQQKEAKSRAASSSLIAFGNPRLPGEVTPDVKSAGGAQVFDPLPDAELEVAALGRIFGQSYSRVMVGRDATEEAFKRQAPSFGIIHLATHGVLNSRRPLYSYLLLAKADGDVDDDGLLEAREIMNMDLRAADLAVLSACDTARGQIGAGEGIIGMSWAFFLAGCQTTVVSQWEVDSSSTTQLMISYYKRLKAGTPGGGPATKAAALRAAALEQIRDARHSHPFYWAGFVMVGSNS